MFFGCHTTEMTAAVRHILTLANLLLNFFGCMMCSSQPAMSVIATLPPVFDGLLDGNGSEHIHFLRTYEEGE